MVFQSYALYPHMTVYENMAFGLKLHGMKSARSSLRVRFDGGDAGDRRPAQAEAAGQLSGGQRQRVAMGARSSAARLHS